jgi:hypothetical protein
MMMSAARAGWAVQQLLAARFDGEVAGGAVADSFFVISGSRRRPRRSQVRGQLRHHPIATAG